ncbi:MAG TPA: hypothetical protein VFB29_12800 [Pseudolabrys sp.]|nr:hypothetical protein [Pseudolabrys sp.]
MSTSSPVRPRQPRRPSRPPQAAGSRSPRVQAVVTVVRTILLGVAAVSVIGTSNYFAYMIGRKQATYEELRRQVDRVVNLMDQKIDDDAGTAPSKQRQDRLEQTMPGLTGLTTSTINGRTTAVAPEPAGRSAPAALIDPPVAAPEAGVQAREASPQAAAKDHDARGPAHRRGSRRPKAPEHDAAGAFAAQPGQPTTAPVAAPDPTVGGQ